MAKIKGIYAAGMSVLNADLSLNVEKTILHSEKIIYQGCHGVAIFGSTGQSQLIPVVEKIELLKKRQLHKYNAEKEYNIIKESVKSITSFKKREKLYETMRHPLAKILSYFG